MPLFEEHHPAISMPEGDELLWRYLEFERFRELLSKSILWFARTDTFEDPFEGSVTPLNIEMRKTAQARRRIPMTLPAALGGLPPDVEGYKRVNFASCWHANDVESMAMWNMYSHKSIVAILSTRSHMRTSFKKSDKEIYLGRVRYKDFSAGTKDFVDESNAFNHFFTKRNNFEYEKEVRAVLLEFPPEESSTPVANEFPKLFRSNVLGVEIAIDPET